MKFRTDFVTNSSDSSFLAFNIKNKKLFDALTALGIKFENVEDGELTDKMTIVLPSGKKVRVQWEDSFCGVGGGGLKDHNSISSWLMRVFCDGAHELFEIFGNAYLPDIKWEMVGVLSENELSKMDEMMTERFGDDTVEAATIEQSYGSEDDAYAVATTVKDGTRMHIEYDSYDLDGMDDEAESCEDLTFVVTGKLKYFENREAIVEYIEDMGGTVSESISKNTDYLICNDINSNSSKINKAKTMCVPILTEVAFIRKFADIEEFDDIKDADELIDELDNYTYGGGITDFLMKNGTSPIYMEVWKDGKRVNTSGNKNK